MKVQGRRKYRLNQTRERRPKKKSDMALEGCGVWDLESHEERFALDVSEGEVYTSWVSGMRVSVLNDVRDIR